MTISVWIYSYKLQKVIEWYQKWTKVEERRDEQNLVWGRVVGIGSLASGLGDRIMEGSKSFSLRKVGQERREVPRQVNHNGPL